MLTLLKFEVRNREYWEREGPSNHVDKRGIFPEGIVKGPRYQSDMAVSYTHLTLPTKRIV